MSRDTKHADSVSRQDEDNENDTQEGEEGLEGCQISPNQKHAPVHENHDFIKEEQLPPC
jgi:hypothetical protein